MAKATFNKKNFFTSKLDVRKKLMKCCIWSIAWYSSKTWTLQKLHHKYLESFKMLCWRRMEISWTDRVRNEELHRVEGEEYLTYNKKEEG